MNQNLNFIMLSLQQQNQAIAWGLKFRQNYKAINILRLKKKSQVTMNNKIIKSSEI